jgi:hypothetical protein
VITVKIGLRIADQTDIQNRRLNGASSSKQRDRMGCTPKAVSLSVYRLGR